MKIPFQKQEFIENYVTQFLAASEAKTYPKKDSLKTLITHAFNRANEVYEELNYSEEYNKLLHDVYVDFNEK